MDSPRDWDCNFDDLYSNLELNPEYLEPMDELEPDPPMSTTSNAVETIAPSELEYSSNRESGEEELMRLLALPTQSEGPLSDQEIRQLGVDMQNVQNTYVSSPVNQALTDMLSVLSNKGKR